MYTLKGIFPEPKKEQKKNFIKENMKQLKYLQGKSTKDTKFMLSVNRHQAGSSLGQVKSSQSNKSGKATFHVGKTSSNSRQKQMDVRIKKGDMAEFLKRKELRQAKEQQEESAEEDLRSTGSSGLLQDVACQTVEVNLSQRLTDSARLTMLYPKKETDCGEGKLKGSGDSDRHRTSLTLSPEKAEEEIRQERNRGRLNSILERKDKDGGNKDPYLPTGYQKGVVPKYLRNRKESTRESEPSGETDAECPSGHVALPDSERKETLRMLRNSFAELVGELNKMPVKTDTLRMRNRKMELEKQLAKLEEGIKVFSRPKVFVKIGE